MLYADKPLIPGRLSDWLAVQRVASLPLRLVVEIVLISVSLTVSMQVKP